MIRTGFFGGGGGGSVDEPSLISIRLMGKAGFSGGVALWLSMTFCLTGSGGGTSSLDVLSIDAMLFCDGEEQTPLPSTLMERLATSARRSRATSERNGRFEISCWFSSITPFEAVFISTVSDDETSSELALDPLIKKEQQIITLHHIRRDYFYLIGFDFSFKWSNQS